MSSASTSASSVVGAWRAGLRWLVWFHRWTGIALCLLFAVWFVTGAVMLFVPFPSLPPGEGGAKCATPHRAVLPWRRP